MRRGAPLLILAAIAAAGCSRSHAPIDNGPRVHLSTTDPERNLAVVLRFVRATCLADVATPAEIAGAIEAQRWPADEVAASAGQPVTVRELEHGRIAYSALPIEVAGGRFGDCQLELDGTVAPSLDRLRAALPALLRGPGLRTVEGRPGETVWRWQPAPDQDREVSLSATAPATAGARPGIKIHVSSSEYTLQSPPPTTTDTGVDPGANVVRPAPVATPDQAPVVAPPPPPAPGSSRWGNSTAPQ